MKNSVYVRMELQDGTNKLADALKLRGFSVAMEGELIKLVNGSEKDAAELKYFLEELNIPVFWLNDNKFQLLVNRLPSQLIKKIIHYKGRNHHYFIEGYQFKWRSFVTRRYGIRTNTLDLCPYTAILVKALNEAGIVTVSGCNGHQHHAPNLQFSGIYYGIWFSIIQEKYLKNLSLYYDWQVEILAGGKTSGLIAHKRDTANWDRIKILADCEKMAYTLQKHARDIRHLKRSCFKRKMKDKAESFRETFDWEKLSEWMKDIVEKHMRDKVS